MQLEMKFGSLSGDKASRKAVETGRFRIAVLGDFSGRANRGEVKTGAELASRKPHRVDVDNLDEVLGRFEISLQLPVSDDGGNVTLEIAEMDDFHPDQLYDQLEIFIKLSNLRDRLTDRDTFDAAAKAVQTLFDPEALARHRHRIGKSSSTRVPNAKLSDFARLIGRPLEAKTDTATKELIKQIVRPHIEAADDPRQEQMVATVDEALSDTMRRVLHHPDFQAVESLWRCVDLLTRRIETGTDLHIVLYDMTAEEIAADLSSTEALENTGLYQLLVEQPAEDAQQGALSLLIGNYEFETTPPHAELLGRMAKIAAAAKAPFVASVSNRCLEAKKPEDIHPLVTQAWSSLRSLPEAAYLGLTVPRFMLRWPYGKKTEPIESFAFEEFTNRSGVSGMLWGNSAFLLGLLLGNAYRRGGQVAAMKLDEVLTVDDLPFYYYTDKHGDQIALPCTDRLLNERLAMYVLSQNFIPVLAIKGQAEVRVGGLRGLGDVQLAGVWPGSGADSGAAPVPAAAPPPTSAQPSPAASPSPPQEATTDAGGDDELDALLAGLDAGTPAASEPPQATDSKSPPPESPAPESPPADDMDAELDSLLAGLAADDEQKAQQAEEDDMDPDLAALLGDL